MHVLAGMREIARALPVADVLEHRALGRCPLVARRAPDRVEQLAAVRAGQGAEGDRRVGHAEGGGADRLDRDPALVGDDRQRVDVAGLALVGAHAGGGVALDVLDRLEALAHGQAQILGGDVVLEVDESLGAGRGDVARHGPGRLQRFLRWLADGRYGRLRRLEARFPGGLRPGPRTLGEARGQRKGTVAGTGRALRLEGLVRHEGSGIAVEAQLAARLREQVDRRVPAARDQQAVAAQPRGLARNAAAVGLHRRHPHAADAQAAIGADHGGPAADRQAGGARPLPAARRRSAPAGRRWPRSRRRHGPDREPPHRRCRCW